MKTKIYLITFLSILLASCSSLQQTSVNDDIYYSPKDELTSENVYKNPTYDKNQTTSLTKDNDKEFSKLLEDDVQNDTLKESENPYESIVVDNYDEAYERRMDAMKSPYYGMNNNYYNIYLSDDYWYAMSYMNDPFYNVVIVGDRIWVEPYWMSSWWGYRPSYYYGYYGYGYPYYNYYGYNGYYGYHSSWYYSPYYYSGYYDPYYYRNYSYDGKKHVNYRRSLVTGSPTRSSLSGSTRDLPETYIGSDIRSSSTVKSGIDRGTVTDTRTKTAVSEDGRRNDFNGETIRVRNSNRIQNGATVRTTEGQSEPNRSYTRPQQSSRSSSYSTPARSTRYSRPQSTGSSSRGSSYSGNTKSSTYTPTRSGSSRSGNSSSGSSYTPRRSSGSSGSSYRGSSSGSSRSSGSSYRSSGSTRSSGSSGSSRSSGSSSSSGSSRGGRR